jgi:hypothetical protein
MSDVWARQLTRLFRSYGAPNCVCARYYKYAAPTVRKPIFTNSNGATYL